MHSKLNLVVVALVAAFALLAPTQSYATTVYYLDIPALVEISDVIVAGEVVDSEVFIGNHSRITTEWTIRVDQSLKGGELTEVRFRQWAGELDGRVQHVPGDGRVELGQRVVLFLRGDSPDALFLSALGQSVFHVMPELSRADGSGPLIQLPTFARPSLGVESSISEDAPVMRDYADIGILLRGDEEIEVVERGPHFLSAGELVRQVLRAVEAGQ